MNRKNGYSQAMTTKITDTEQLYFKIPWFLLSRLSIFVLLLIIIIVFLHVPDLFTLPFTLYSLVTLALLLLITLGLNKTQTLLFGVLVTIHFLLEVIIETLLIHHTGGIESPFAILFILSILSASLIYRVVGSTVMAGLSSLGYAVVLLTEEGFGFSLNNLQLLSDASFYKAFLYVCTFFLVAFISGYLAQRLKVKGEELWNASLELNKIRADTGEILKHMKSGLITVDVWGRIVYFNRSAEEILGYSEAEVKGKDCREVFRERMPKMAEKILQVIKFNQGDSRGFLYINGKSKRKIPIGISTTILGDKRSGIRGVIAIFQDITEVIKLEERIRMADRLATVGELSAGIAHEIRNPLASISGSVEVLKDETSLSEESQKLLDLIIKETGRLNQILTDFLEYSRIGPSLLSKVELVHLLDEVIQIVRKHPLYKSSISINRSLSSEVLYVLGEENQIKQIILNLLVNAMEAMEEKGGEIQISDKGLNQMDQFYFWEEEPD
ncbi:MAG TPA: histidine kinase dimerization/phospho-acceptor domain-containing protein, partial [candidate division Zixibacteria bacterium]